MSSTAPRSMVLLRTPGCHCFAMLPSAASLLPARPRSSTAKDIKSTGATPSAGLIPAVGSEPLPLFLLGVRFSSPAEEGKPEASICSGNGHEHHGQDKLDGDLAPQTCASTCGTDDSGATSPGDAPSMNCVSESSEAGDQVREGDGSDADTTLDVAEAQSPVPDEGKVHLPEISAADATSHRVRSSTDELLSKARVRLLSDTNPAPRAGCPSRVLQAVAGRWHVTIAGEVTVCDVSADGHTHYDGVHLGDQYDLFDRQCMGGVAGIGRGDGWYVDMAESKVGLLLWKKGGEDDVPWFRVATPAGATITSPSAAGSNESAPSFSGVVQPAGETGKTRPVMQAHSEARPETSDPAGRQTKPAAALQAVVGPWQLTIAGEITVCTIGADGCMHRNGIPMGDQYDLVEYECASGVKGIRRGDGWVVDMAESKMGMLVWRREGEADDAWYRVPSPAGAAEDTSGVVRPAGLFSCSPCMNRASSP